MYSKRQNICSTLILTTTNNLNRMVLFLINFFDNIYHQIVLSNILLISQTQKKGKRREGKKVISLKFGSFGCYGHCSNSRMVWFKHLTGDQGHGLLGQLLHCVVSGLLLLPAGDLEVVGVAVGGQLVVVPAGAV